MMILNEDYFDNLDIDEEDIEIDDDIQNDTIPNRDCRYSITLGLSIPTNDAVINITDKDNFDKLANMMSRLSKYIEIYMESCDAFTYVGDIEFNLAKFKPDTKKYGKYIVRYNSKSELLFASDISITFKCDFMFRYPE